MAGADKGEYFLGLGSTLSMLWRRIHRSLLSNRQRRKGNCYIATFLDDAGHLVHDSESLEAYHCLVIKRTWFQPPAVTAAVPPPIPAPTYRPHYPLMPFQHVQPTHYFVPSGGPWSGRRRRSHKNNADLLRRQLVKILGHSVAFRGKGMQAGCDLLHQRRLRRRQRRK